MRTMIIAASVALSALANAAVAHPQKPVAQPDFAKQLFEQLDRNSR